MKQLHYITTSLLVILLLGTRSTFALGPEYPGINIKVQPGKILGRSSQGTGKVEYITPGTGLVMTNGILSATAGSGDQVPLAAPAHYPGRAGGTSPVVGAATVVDPGSGYWPNDYIQVQGGQGDAPAYLVVDSVKLVSVDIDNPGTGYSQGDYVYLTFSGDVNAVLQIDTVGGSGEVTSAHFNPDSQYYSWQLAGVSEPESPTGGTGSGFSITNILFGARTVYVYSDGSYTQMPSWPALTVNLYNGNAFGLTIRPWDVGAYEEGDTLTLAGGTTATVESTTISSVIIENGGIGYTEGDLLRGDWAVQSPIFRVSQVDDNGGVLAVEIQNGGRFWSTTLAPGEESPRWQLRDGNELYQLYVDSSPSGLRLIPTYGVYNAAITSAGSFDGSNPVAQTSTSGRGAAATFNLLTKDGGAGFTADVNDSSTDAYTYDGNTLADGGFSWDYQYDLSYNIPKYTQDMRRLFVVAREHSFSVDWRARLLPGHIENYFYAFTLNDNPTTLYLDASTTPNWFAAEVTPVGSFVGASSASALEVVTAYGPYAVNFERNNNPDGFGGYDDVGFAFIEFALHTKQRSASPSTILQMSDDSPYNYDVSQLLTYGGDVTLLRDRINAQKDLRRFDWYNQYFTGVLNFSGFDKLEYVDIHDNYLSSVDFTGCTALKELYMDDTYYAQNLVLTNLTSLEYVSAEYFGDNLSEPGRVLVANNPKLTYLDLFEPYSATNIVVTNCPLLAYIDIGNSYGNDSFDVSLELRDVPSATEVYFSDGHITNIVVSGLSSRLWVFEIRNNRIPTANVNAILQTLDATGGYSGILRLQDQTPPAPPSGAGLISLTNLINRGWDVLTD